jgi:hypothetical protein
LRPGIMPITNTMGGTRAEARPYDPLVLGM